MTTLYLSDLDGTLLGPNERLSPKTSDVVTRFVRSGGLFSFATARSLITAQRVTAGLPLELPAIVYNGVFIVRAMPREVLHSNGSQRRTSITSARRSQGWGFARSCTP